MYQYIDVRRHPGVEMIRLHRPDVMNALSAEMMIELSNAMEKAEKDREVGCIVLSGSEKAFAAGADIKGLGELTYIESYLDNPFNWDTVPQLRKPIIAAVSGYALGGGCELAMMCDLIFAAENAKFGQPEIKLGVLPGGGGTQRLARAVGRAKAMDLCLTGRMMDAHEAEKSGLVSRVVATDQLLDIALQAATSISRLSLPAVMLMKESINHAFESTLSAGLKFERHLFQSLLGTPHQREGMSAFLEGRPPNFQVPRPL